MKVTGMCLKSDFLAEVFVLWSMGNDLVPSPHSHPIYGVFFYFLLCHESLNY